MRWPEALTPGAPALHTAGYAFSQIITSVSVTWFTVDFQVMGKFALTELSGFSLVGLVVLHFVYGKYIHSRERALEKTPLVAVMGAAGSKYAELIGQAKSEGQVAKIVKNARRNIGANLPRK